MDPVVTLDARIAAADGTDEKEAALREGVRHVVETRGFISEEEVANAIGLNTADLSEFAPRAYLNGGLESMGLQEALSSAFQLPADAIEESGTVHFALNEDLARGLLDAFRVDRVHFSSHRPDQVRRLAGYLRAEGWEPGAPLQERRDLAQNAFIKAVNDFGYLLQAELLGAVAWAAKDHQVDIPPSRGHAYVPRMAQTKLRSALGEAFGYEAHQVRTVHGHANVFYTSAPTMLERVRADYQVEKVRFAKLRT